MKKHLTVVVLAALFACRPPDASDDSVRGRKSPPPPPVYQFDFQVQIRPVSPELASLPYPRFSRHHIIPQTMLQLIFRLSEHSGVNERFLLGFGRYPAYVQSPLFAKFIWSPFNLFIGPEDDLRTYPAGSEIESTRPPCFPSARWNALMEFPKYLTRLGIDLKTLYTLRPGSTQSFRVNLPFGEIKADLESIFREVIATSSSDRVKPYPYVDSEWLIYNPEITIPEAVPTTNPGATCQFIRRNGRKIDIQPAQAISDGYKFILCPETGAQLDCPAR